MIQRLIPIAIVGSRDFPDRAPVAQLVAALHREATFQIISGGCPSGPDRWAVDVARQLGMVYGEFPANWEIHGKAMAGKIRNTGVVSAARLVVAFTTGSSGTADTLDKAERLGVKSIVLDPKDARWMASEDLVFNIKMLTGVPIG